MNPIQIYSSKYPYFGKKKETFTLTKEKNEKQNSTVGFKCLLLLLLLIFKTKRIVIIITEKKYIEENHTL